MLYPASANTIGEAAGRESFRRTPKTDTMNTETISKLRSLMKDVKFCMFTTADSEGHLHSRPMALQQAEFNGDLWFFTGKSTHKAAEIADHQQVNVSFAKPDEQVYVSVSGRAFLLEDRQKAAELWTFFYRAWFPRGVEDEDLVLIKVEVEQAEYWDSPSSAMVQLFGTVKAAITGEPAKIGKHESILVRG